MKKIISIILAHDKLKHFFIGTLIALFSAIVYNLEVASKVWVLIPCFAVAIGKDLVYDKYLGRGNFEWLDIVYTVFSSIIIFFLL